jgi:predicted CopG family antitoxin
MSETKHMTMRQSGFKVIVVSPDNHQRLADMGRKNERFNEIIAGLIELRNRTNNTIRSEPSLEAGLTPLSGTKGAMNPDG